MLIPKEDKALRDHIKETLKNGLIQPYFSPYGVPVFFVSKKDGTLWPITKYHTLNASKFKNKYHLLLIYDLLDLVGGKFLSKMDLTAGYNKLRGKQDAITKTAFPTCYRCFNYKVLNFNISNVPSTFFTLMNRFFKLLVSRCAVVYLRDIIVYYKAKQFTGLI